MSFAMAVKVSFVGLRELHACGRNGESIKDEEEEDGQSVFGQQRST